MDPTRFFQIYVVMGLFGMFYSFIGIKILRRNPNVLNKIVSGFYFCSAAGAFLNVVYASIFIETMVWWLYALTIVVLNFAPYFLLLFVLNLYTPKDIPSKLFQLVLTLLYASLQGAVLLIPGAFRINEGTQWKPEWSWIGFLYIFLVIIIVIVIPSTGLAVKMHSRFTDDTIKKRWRYFTAGMEIAYMMYLGALFSHALGSQAFRMTWSILSLFLVIVSGLAMYHGIGKKL